MAQGGRYSAGFWSGFASSILNPFISKAGTTESRVAAAAIVGGTASAKGGGKFVLGLCPARLSSLRSSDVNGAVSGAFVHMFNAEVGASIAKACQKILTMNVNKIISSFEKMRELPYAQRLMLLYKFTKNGSLLDFKQEGSQYQDYGNFVFGAVGTAMDIDDAILLRGAGWAQMQAGTSRSEWGTYYGIGGSYGDDPNDQTMIKWGIWYYKNIYLKDK